MFNWEGKTVFGEDKLLRDDSLRADPDLVVTNKVVVSYSLQTL